MRRNLRRTHATSLSDDQLTLLDVLFNCTPPRGALLKDYIYGQFLRRHSLEDEEVDSTLDGFLRQGWLSLTRVPLDGSRLQGQPCFTMTTEGGRIWESERRPNWSRYLIDIYGGVPIEKESISIISTMAETGQNCWRIGFGTRYFDHGLSDRYRPGRFRQTIIRDYELLPWKTFDKLHVLVGILEEPTESFESQVTCDDYSIRRAEWEANIAEWELRRTWWRDVGELAKFWIPPA
jgi:hypothetical protein